MVCANNTHCSSINNSTTKLQKDTRECDSSDRTGGERMHRWALNPQTGLRQRCAFWWRWVKGGGWCRVLGGLAGCSPAAATSLRALSDWAPGSGLSLWAAAAAQGGAEERNAWSPSPRFPPAASRRCECLANKGRAAWWSQAPLSPPFISTASRTSLMLSSAC